MTTRRNTLTGHLDNRSGDLINSGFTEQTVMFHRREKDAAGLTGTGTSVLLWNLTRRREIDGNIVPWGPRKLRLSSNKRILET